MGSVHQLEFVKRNKHLVQGPILEVGSKDYGTTPDLRVLFPGYPYTATDMEAGKNVDIVADLTVREEAMPLGMFNTIFNFSVMEHCDKPFDMARNLTELLEPGGYMFIGVPFVWKIHGYPSDYWRFTPDGIKALFPQLDFDYPNETTDSYGKRKAIDKKFSSITIQGIKASIKAKRYPWYIGVTLYLCRVLHIMPIIFQHPILFPEVMITMIGRKPHEKPAL